MNFDWADGGGSKFHPEFESPREIIYVHSQLLTLPWHAREEEVEASKVEVAMVRRANERIDHYQTPRTGKTNGRPSGTTPDSRLTTRNRTSFQIRRSGICL